MSRDAALLLLGLDTSATPDAIERALDETWTLTQRLADTAPTHSIRETYETRMRQLEEAGRTLLGATFVQRQDAATEAPAPNSRAPVSPAPVSPAPVPTDADSTGTDDSIGLREGRLLAKRYEVRESIGAGGMGAVYRAFDRIRDSDIAIKVMLPRLLDVSTVKERFLHEARLSSELAHPNIVNAYDVGSEGELLFLTMELLQGTTLRQLINGFLERDEPFPVERAVEIASSVCSALDYAHANIIHRDVKPENVFVCEDGTVKLMDFGISRAAASTTITITGATVGTLKYMAPEQLQGAKDIDGRADQYSTARMLYEMLAGEVSDDGSRSLNELRSDVSESLARAIARGMELNRAQRFPTAREFGEALMAVDVESTEPTGRSVPLLITMVVLVVIAAVSLSSVFGAFGAFGGTAGGRFDTARVSVAQEQYEALLGEWRTLAERTPAAVASLALPDGFVQDAREAAERRDAEAAVSAWSTASERLEAALVTARERLAASERTAREADEAREEELAKARAALGDRTKTATLGEHNFALVRCSAGTFTMGSPASEEGRDDDEARRRESVDEFWIGETEVTQGQWEAVMDARPWEGMPNSTTGAQVAVTHVTWNDAVNFCRRLTELEREEGLPPGYSYRLPLEVEWEYACRAGTSTAFSFGNDAGGLARHAVFGRSLNASNAHAAPVQSKEPNRWGLFDMHGNVWEWTATTLADDGPRGFHRGGSWNFDAQRCRSANRSWSDPLQASGSLGFRVVLARDVGD